MLGLAARLPGLRRVDLETNHRCAPEVVRRAARLVEHNEERFDKRILASARNSGSVHLLPDSGDEVARARLLLTSWVGREPDERYAVLARTNRELAPFAAIALELGQPYRVEEDGLHWPDQETRKVLMTIDPSRPLLPALALAAAEGGFAPETAAGLLGWAAAYPDIGALLGAIDARLEAQDRLRGEVGFTLATAHGTKGLEWDHVACIGHDEGAFPSGRALRQADDPLRVLEEERRLAYVAWTRARKTLTLVYDPGAPSTFVLEAFDPDELP